MSHSPDDPPSDRASPATPYPLVERSSHYYRVMTRSEWAPALVGEVI